MLLLLLLLVLLLLTVFLSYCRHISTTSWTMNEKDIDKDLDKNVRSP